ncbi:hypothetical protein [Marmoricola sp. RAF53]|uniref:hypothetical protein n=1 Tax=Marmoricola sp. RAF53 TaxID=3233059 RepID=UPI003F9AFEAC
MTDWAQMFTDLLATRSQPQTPRDLLGSAPIPLAYGVMGDYGFLSVREALPDGEFGNKELEFSRGTHGWQLIGYGGGSGSRDLATDMNFTDQPCEVVSAKFDSPAGHGTVHVWFHPDVRSAAIDGRAVQLGAFNHAVVFVPKDVRTVTFDRVEGEDVPDVITLDLGFLS